jgi:pimeloyl-ACP methyl ester carboxylesterase
VAGAILAVANAHPPLHGVIAHSFGTVATLHAITQGLAPQRMAALCAPSSIEFLMDSFAEKLELPASVMAVHRRLMEARFGTDLWKRFSPEAAARGLQIPALLIHDQDDHDVPLQEGKTLSKAWLGATWVQTRGHGHRRILRDPDVVARVVAFMADTSAPL